MTAAVARVGDSAAGFCLQHGSPPLPWVGMIAVGSPTTTVGGSPVARVGDTGWTSCGHTFRIEIGSSILRDTGAMVARKGDPVIVIGGGYGSISSGQESVQSD